MPTAVATFSEVLEAGSALITDFALTPFILAAGVMWFGAKLFRKFKAAAG